MSKVWGTLIGSHEAQPLVVDIVVVDTLGERSMIGDLKSFDQMVNLAKDNPELLEKMRKREVESIIQAAPRHMQRRLRGLQFQIDAKRQGQKNSMSACITISRMMHESLNRLNAVLNGKPRFDEETKEAKVLSFPATG